MSSKIEQLTERLVDATNSSGQSSPYGLPYVYMAVGALAADKEMSAARVTAIVDSLLAMSDEEFREMADGTAYSNTDDRCLFLDHCTCEAWSTALIDLVTE